MTKRRIALLVSLMFAAPAAVVALEQAASTGESTETKAEMSQPAEGAAQPAETAASSEAPAVEVATTEAVTTERVVVAEARPAPANPVSRFFRNIARASTSDAFPMGSTHGDYLTWHLPAQAQYLARLDEQRSTMLASRGQGFPMGSAEGEYGHASPLAGQVAHFDRAEQARIAASQPRAVARAEVVTPAPVSADQSAQAGSSEVVIADTSAIR